MNFPGKYRLNSRFVYQQGPTMLCECEKHHAILEAATKTAS
jgi:hypothetical protein